MQKKADLIHQVRLPNAKTMCPCWASLDGMDHVIVSREWHILAYTVENAVPGHDGGGSIHFLLTDKAGEASQVTKSIHLMAEKYRGVGGHDGSSVIISLPQHAASRLEVDDTFAWLRLRLWLE